MNIQIFYYIIKTEGSVKMKKRTLSAVVLLIILVGAVFFGYKVFSLVMLLASIFGYYELFQIKYEKRKQNIAMIQLLGYFSLIFLVLNDIFFTIDNNILVILPILALSIPVVFYRDYDTYNINDAFYIMGSIFFLGFSFHNIAFMAKMDIYKCILIFLIAFTTDTYAYIGGNLIGKHPLTEISPNKTIEGSIIGTIMGVLIGTVYYNLAIGGVGTTEMIFICLILTLLSEIGDLVMSSIKRYFHKKDYSNLIPGHGGILDRFDSVLFVSLGLSIIVSIL